MSSYVDVRIARRDAEGDPFVEISHPGLQKDWKKNGTYQIWLIRVEQLSIDSSLLAVNVWTTPTCKPTSAREKYCKSGFLSASFSGR